MNWMKICTCAHGADQGIDGFNLLRPFASGVAQRQALGGLAILAHHLADAFEFARQFLFQSDDLVKRVGDFPIDAGSIFGQTCGKIAVFDSHQALQQQPGIQ